MTVFPYQIFVAGDGGDDDVRSGEEVVVRVLADASLLSHKLESVDLDKNRFADPSMMDGPDPGSRLHPHRAGLLEGRSADLMLTVYLCMSA